MTSSAPTLKTPRLLAEYRSDSRGLWVVAILVSAALHLMLGWAIVRLLLVEGKATAQSQQEVQQKVIQIEAVAIAPTPQPSPSPSNSPKQSSATVPAPTSSSNATPQTPASTERTPSKSKSWRWFRPGARGQSQQPPEALLQERTNSSQSTSQQRTRNTQRRVHSASGEPIFNESAAASNPNNTRSSSRRGTQQRVNSASGEPIFNESAASSRSRSSASRGTARRFSGAGSESLLGDVSGASGTSSGVKSGSRGSEKSQSGSSAQNPPSSPPASNTAQNRGVTASLGTPRLTDRDRDIPDTLATPQQNSQQFSVLPLGVRLSEPVVLETIAIIEPNGKATVNQTKIVSGAIDSQKAQELAKSIVEGWNFDPTLMAGQPVAQVYSIELRLSPIAP
ncbi:MAG: hypothetical protein SW833_26675 [Cyanobacteriota bacterium]|nr:hypothetical protein [Cyanobacteriota bacterium]